MATEPLKTAYQLIKSGDKAQAMQILIPIVKADGDNLNAWWLIANAASKQPEIEFALKQVLRLNPDHIQAQQMMENLFRPVDFPTVEDFIPVRQPVTPSIPTTRKQSSRLNRGILIGLGSLGVVVVLVCVVVVALMTIFEKKDPPELIDGWRRFEGRGAELQLPANYDYIDMSQNLDTIVDEMANISAEFDSMADSIRQNPDLFVFFAYDTQTLNQGFVTNVNVTMENVSYFSSLEDNIDSSVRSLPSLFTVAERDIVKLKNYEAGRLVLESTIYGTQIKQLAYIFKTGNRAWVVTYTTQASLYEAYLSIFEQSIETFFVH